MLRRGTDSVLSLGPENARACLDPFVDGDHVTEDKGRVSVMR